MRTIGTSRGQILGLFLVNGLLLGALGALLGVGLGAWGASESQAVMNFLEGLLGVDLLNPDVYFLDYLPAELRLPDLLEALAAAPVVARNSRRSTFSPPGAGRR